MYECLFTGNILIHFIIFFKACKSFWHRFHGEKCKVQLSVVRLIQSYVLFLTWINPAYVDTTWSVLLLLCDITIINLTYAQINHLLCLLIIPVKYCFYEKNYLRCNGFLAFKMRYFWVLGYQQEVLAMATTKTHTYASGLFCWQVCVTCDRRIGSNFIDCNQSVPISNFRNHAL